MKKIEFRSLSLVLVVILLLSAIVGCDPAEPSGDPSLTTGEGTAATVGTQATTASRTLPAGEITTEATTEATTGAPTNQPYWDGDALCFHAGIFVDDPSVSWGYRLNVRIENDNIYINDILYKKTSSPTPPAIVYGVGYLNYAAALDQQEYKGRVDTLQRIQESDLYCVLEAQEQSNFGQILYVYKFENAYYFVRMNNDGEVSRIHYAILDQEVF
ncbi:MAG: hypothetical protein IKB75_07510 [Clostridia bacterium]|nr:hypothetical protein [Clostridia bacterium]